MCSRMNQPSRPARWQQGQQLAVLWCLLLVLVLCCCRALASDEAVQRGIVHSADGSRQLSAASDDTVDPHTVLVATLDGQVHAVDSRTGAPKWSLSTGAPLLSSYQQLPGILDSKSWLVHTVGGGMLMQTNQGLRWLGQNARHLQAQPFLEQGGVIIVRSEKQSVLRVDAETGAVVQVLSGSADDSDSSSGSSDAALPPNSSSSSADSKVLLLHRTDYTVRAHDKRTGSLQWNVTIGEFDTMDGSDLSTDIHAARGHAIGLPLSTGTPDGGLHYSVPPSPGGVGGQPLDWEATFDAPVSAVFMVGRGAEGAASKRPLHKLPLRYKAVSID
jgi:outer membrane protein assembly factor BamB